MKAARRGHVSPAAAFLSGYQHGRTRHGPCARHARRAAPPSRAVDRGQRRVDAGRAAGGPGPLRSAARARRLRRRLRRPHQGQARRTRSWPRASSCSSTSSTAAPAAARPTPATAPASWSRSRTGSCARSPPRSASRCPPTGRYGAGLVFLPHDAAQRADLIARFEALVTRRGAGRPRLARRADRRLDAGRLGPARPAGLQADLRRQRRRHRGGGGSARLRAQALRHPQAPRASRSTRSTWPSKKAFYVVSLSSRTLIYKGMLTAAQLPEFFVDLRDAGPRVGAGAGPPALQHQHLPVLAAGAPVPLHRAQRRDQHPARQHQLDARPRGPAPVAALRRRPAEAAAGHPRGRQRHRHLRQRARVPGHERALAAARHADDDPRAVAEPRDDDPARRRSTSTTRR